jgi:translation initiation factor IF-1
MAKEEQIEMNGVVDEVLPDCRYRVSSVPTFSAESLAS